MKAAKAAYPGWFAPAEKGANKMGTVPQYAPFTSAAKQHADVVNAAAVHNNAHLNSGNWFPANTPTITTTQSFKP